MKKYRGQQEIIREILDQSQSPKSKTKIMYDVYLSYTQVVPYLEMLLKKGLLNFSSKNQQYNTTPKGMEVLALCEKLGEYLKEEVV